MRARANGGSYVHGERGERQGEHDLLELYPALTNPPSLSAVSGDPLSKVVKQLRVAFAPPPIVPASPHAHNWERQRVQRMVYPKGTLKLRSTLNVVYFRDMVDLVRIERGPTRYVGVTERK